MEDKEVQFDIIRHLDYAILAKVRNIRDKTEKQEDGNLGMGCDLNELERLINIRTTLKGYRKVY